MFFLKLIGITLLSPRLAVRSKCGRLLRLATLGAPPATAFRYHQGYCSSPESFRLRRISFFSICPFCPFCLLNDLKDLNDINALVHNLTLVSKKYQQALGSNGTKEKLKKESTAEKIAPAVASYLVARKTGNSMIKVPSLRFKGIFMLYWIAPCIR